MMFHLAGVEFTDERFKFAITEDGEMDIDEVSTSRLKICSLLAPRTVNDR